MLSLIQTEIEKILRLVGVTGPIELSKPPKSEMGDAAFACFGLAKELKKSPVEVAKGVSSEFRVQSSELIERVEAFGPYVNFFLNGSELAKNILKVALSKKFGQNEMGKKKRMVVEYAQPNTHKAFHIGHLRNIITGESLCRILENSGYKVARVNYQGDVGLHIAKCLYGIFHTENYEEKMKALKSVDEKAKFLGGVYTAGSGAYEIDEKAKKEVEEINQKIYYGDKSIKKLYEKTRKWSLEYFDKIYKRIGTKFDRLYFESETFGRGRDIVQEFVKKGVFKQSQGAVIFEGEKYGLHNRVFLNSLGLPTYEAKDTALAELQMKEWKPEMIYHVVGKEQSEYFKVLFRALEQIFPSTAGKEKHLVYGWVSLKEGKMSSRTGNVILGEGLLDEAKQKITEIMAERKVDEETAEKIALAAVKYSFLRPGVSSDIVFDLKESVNLTGDCGPYLLYIVARVRSIFRDANQKLGKIIVPAEISPEEKQLMLHLAEYPEATALAASEANPSKVAHYLLGLAQSFNVFYDACPVLKAEGNIRSFRLSLIKAVEETMVRGLYLLGIETVEEM